MALSAAEDLVNSQIYLRSQSRPLQVAQYVQREQTPILSYTLQLPRAESPSIPFNNPEAIVDLQPPLPSNQEIPSYYEYPEPSVDLQAPNEGSWNPNNDPNLYYNNVPVVLDIDTPTNLHPKKFEKEEEKKYSSDPKKGVIFKPITGDELSQLQKAVNKIAKLENQKQIRREKVPKKQFVHNAPIEPDTAYSEFNDNTVEDISADMINSLGVKAQPGERYQFHMHGHKGPNSYKWGFDTGKG